MSIDQAPAKSLGPGEPAVQLTTYFGERSRMHGRLLANELFEIYARQTIRNSILLRGAQGFGARHRLRTDRLLTLSEDLPLVSVAVDSRERIATLAAEVSAIGAAGLMTLEPARLGAGYASREQRPVDLQRGNDEQSNLVLGPEEEVSLTLYLGRHQRANGAPAFAAVCQALYDSGVAGATVLLGVDGTSGGRRERARFFARNASVPMMIASVGNARAIESALARAAELVREPLYTVKPVRVCKRDGVLLRSPRDGWPAGAYEEANMHQKLTIITSEAARHEKRPVYLELVRRLRTSGALGATSLRGIWGFHGKQPPHGDRLLSIRRHVPIVTIAIDTPERIGELFPLVDELTRERGLVISELVPLISAPHAPAGL